LSAGVEEKGVRAYLVPPELVEEMKKHVVKARVITPQSLAMKYGIRVSVARRLLRQWEREGLVVYIDGNSRLRIYTGAKAPSSR